MKVLLCGKSFAEASPRLVRHLSESRHKLIVCAQQEINKYRCDEDIVFRTGTEEEGKKTRGT